MKYTIYLFFILFFISCGPSKEEFDELKQELAELKENKSDNNNEDEQLKENNSNQQTNPNVTIEQINPNPTNSKHLKEEDNEEERARPVENPEPPPSGKEENTQEESPIESSSNSTDNKYDYSDLFGNGNSDQGFGEGMGSEGIGAGTGPSTSGDGYGDGNYRIANSEILKNTGEGSSFDFKWNGGYVMVEFIILPSGDVENAKVLFPNKETTITMTSQQKKEIERQCVKNFKFSKVSSGKGKEKVVKKIQFHLE